MGDTRDKPVGTGENPYIWLRYTTQFTTGGRTHTIEMGIPMPLGASAETREQLIREAEAGMDQLSRHVDNRVIQMLQRNARPQGQPTLQGASSPLQPSTSSTFRPPTPSTFGTPQSSSSPAPAREAMQPSSLTPARPNTNIGASMPLSPNMPGEASGNIKLSQFMHYIRESWGLTPKQAMELLNVKTLNGLNYREALKQLQPLVAGNQGSTPTPLSPASTNVPSEREVTLPGSTSQQMGVRDLKDAPKLRGTPATPDALRAPSGSTGSSKIPIIPISSGMVRDAQSVYRFDEEDDKELEPEEDREDEDHEQQQIMARIKLDELKEVRGSSVVSSARLLVLQNVTNSQISETQLQQLIRAAWGATSLKKLKVDQVEALISWAKEDLFVDEAEAVLALIAEEDSYARSDW